MIGRTESLWSQIMSESVAGSKSGVKLEIIPTAYQSWEQWKARHPKTKVLSRETGFARNYDREPYQAYLLQEELMFPVKMQSELFSNKEKVLGLTLNGKHKAYPFSELKKAKGKIIDQFEGKEIHITFNRSRNTAIMKDVEGNVLPAVRLFWFAWYAFHPETEVWRWGK